jgi:hypothetical protein
MFRSVQDSKLIKCVYNIKRKKSDCSLHFRNMRVKKFCAFRRSAYSGMLCHIAHIIAPDILKGHSAFVSAKWSFNATGCLNPMTSQNIFSNTVPRNSHLAFREFCYSVYVPTRLAHTPKSSKKMQWKVSNYCYTSPETKHLRTSEPTLTSRYNLPAAAASTC